MSPGKSTGKGRRRSPHYQPILRLIGWLVPLEFFHDRRFWQIVALPAINLLILGITFYHTLQGTHGYALVQLKYHPLSSNLWGAPLTVMMYYRFMLSIGPMLLPIPLWLLLLERKEPKSFRSVCSWPLLIVSEAAILWAILHHEKLFMALPTVFTPSRDALALSALLQVMLVAGLGYLASFFVFVPLGEVWRRAQRAARATVVMVMGCLAPLLGIWFASSFWAFTSGGTVMLVHRILQVFCAQTPTVAFAKEFAPSLIGASYATISSDYVNVIIYSACSGADGISMMLYLLTIFLLVDWSFFERRLPIITVCLIGTFVMILVNAMRIAAIFCYAQWLGVHESAERAQTVSVELFHTNIGWVVDAAAITLFLLVVYRYASRRRVS